MIEMVYQKERTSKILDKGTFKGFDYVIVSYGSHPCCYVFLPENHKYFKKDYMEIIDKIECHGGLTFSCMDKDFAPLPSDTNKWVLGWDYAHYDDYCGYYGLKLGGKKHTTTELLEDVKKVIDQL